MAKTPNYDDALPQCPGPKLQPFPQRRLKVIFNRLISDSESAKGHTDTGGHAHVFAVSIGRKNYALKIVSICPVRKQLDQAECKTNVIKFGSSSFTTTKRTAQD